MTLEHAEPLAWEESRITIGLVAAIPAAFLLIGLVVRYAAFAAGDPDPAVAGFVDALCRWDCKWYLNIADNGYDAFPTTKAGNVGNWGFFPLYPGFIHLLDHISPLTMLQNATVVSLGLGYAACLVAWPLLERDLRSYVVFSAYVLAGPFSYYFSTFLTESLYLLLSLLAVLGLQRRAYLAAGGASALLSATRIVGVFFVFATVMTMLEDHRRAGGRLGSFPAHLLRRPDLLLAIIISPLGLFAYMLLLWMTVGDGFAFSNVQRAFGREIDWPWLHWLDGARTISKDGWWPTAPQWSAFAVVVGLGLTAALAMRRQFALALFCLICILLPLSTGLPSIVRYIAALAPLVLVMSALLARTWAFVLASVCLAVAACYVLTMQWIGGHLALV